jgi:glutathione S-transferase
VKVRLYTIPGSHPGAAVQAMMRAKGIEFKRTDLFPVMQKAVVRLRGFPRQTVPAIVIDGRRVQGSREIARELDRVHPEPPLFPSDPEQRALTDEAERFGDEELQHPIRQIVWWALRKDPSPLRSYMQGARLGIPIGLAVRTAAPVLYATARYNEASDENVRRGLTELPGFLDRIDAWIEAGALDGEQLHAADYQIAASLRLAMTLQDLRPAIDARPAGKLARRAIPEYAGDAPPVLPPAWLGPLRSPQTA